MTQIQIVTTLRRRPPGPTPPPVPLWMHREDTELAAYGYRVRSCAPCPAIIPLLERSQPVDKQWQFYVRAINEGMSIAHVTAIYGHFKAFANGTGFGDPADPRANYLTNENLGAELPQFDKVRTCIRSVLTGTPSGAGLEAAMLDGTEPPPLKPGRRYPERPADIRLDDYLYSPRTHPWLFFVANIINRAGEVVPFPNGAVYAWTGDGRPRTFLPHLTRFPVTIPLASLRPVGAPPSPYRP